MATGNRVLPEALILTERAVAAEQHMTVGRGAGTIGTAVRPGADAGDTTGQESEQPQRVAGRGAGGRWLVWTLRALVWVVLLLIGYRGVLAIVDSYREPGSAAGSTQSGGFPVQLAGAFGLEFAQVYLNFSPATAAQRADELAPFLPSGSGSDPQFGWNGSGALTVQSEQLAGVDVQNAHSAVVKVLALANNQIIEIGIPVYYADGGIVVSGQPAFVSPPPGLVLPPPAKVITDKKAEQQLIAQLPAFFRAYAGSDAAKINQFAAPGVKLSGLNGDVGFGSILTVTVPQASGTVRQITVTVAWLPVSSPSAGTSVGGRAQIDMTYAMTVVQKAGKWYVSSIEASTALPGPSS
jgi:Conjugative transposon protein TcpC